MQVLFSKYKKHPMLERFVQILETNEQVQIRNAKSSARSFFVAAIYNKISKPLVVSLGDKEEAAYFYNDLQTILSPEKIFFFPATIRHLTHDSGIKTDKAAIMMRTETITKIPHIANPIIVTYPAAIAETVIAKENIANNIIELNVDEKVETDFLIEILHEYGFVKKDFVYEPGQYSIRGGIIDVFSFSAEFPFRLDFFGDEIESIRAFDIETQFSIKKLDKVQIVSNLQFKDNEKRTSFLQLMDKKTVLFTDDYKYLLDKVEDLSKKQKEIKLLNPDTELNEIIQYVDFKDFAASMNGFKLVHLSNTVFENVRFVELNVNAQPAIQKNFNLLANDLKLKQKRNFATYIMSNSDKQIERLKDILQSNEVQTKVEFLPIKGTMHEGFTDNDLGVLAYTDHQIFNRFHRFLLKKYNIGKSKETQLLQEIKELNIGDYIVHYDYGVGVFKGLTTIENDGKKQEVVRIEYRDRDSLFVNIHSLHKISKFKGQDAEPPKINKLGTAAWKTTKNKTQKHIKDIAKDLIELYAKRMHEKGFAFSEDTYLQDALEASFLYDETPDQSKAITDVKADMEKNIPMDRLVCGDVGFGKTEIAIRAAFKAVCDNKQVALLCPTTILAYQHYRTFTARMQDLPVTIDYISRMRTAKQSKEILQKLADKKIDILIGTHRLVSKDVKFNDLGLLIIDEEQKFGVAVKEELKQLRVNVDTLTLTATPIPRTLQFSLMGARDLSVLQTPPANRQPIITELHTLNENIVRKAINYEIRRGGQVFFIHNHIATLPKMKEYINKIVPDAVIRIGHGRIKATELEKTITDFIKGEFDILLTTSIVENGLDIPNANTIIINNAHKFGLSDLHQIRGRVGRASRKGFCYLFAPPKTSLSAVAKKRLTAIENFVELGSGFNIALQDLDIRGAGDLLGAAQSGFINSIGYETFKRILEETMLELRTTEYKHIFSEEDNKNNNEGEHSYISDCQITTDLNIGFPEDYISNETERLKIYRELDSLKDEERINQFENDLTDRFGKLDEQGKELLNILRLRMLAISLGIEKITMKNGAFICYLISNQDSAFYDSPIFARILTFVQKNYSCEMKQKNEKLFIRFNKITTVKKALGLLREI